MQIHSTIQTDLIYLEQIGTNMTQYKEPYACVCCNPEQSLPYIECQVINKKNVEVEVDKNKAVNIFVIVDI